MTTQAPWSAEKSGIYSNDGTCVAMRHPQAGREWVKNAPVLAAAPMMLIALKATLELLDGLLEGDDKPEGARAFARSVIAKATA
jgi:hypothetical protein